jgi:hypothetical protein
VRRNDSPVSGGESHPHWSPRPCGVQSQRDHGRTAPVDYFQPLDQRSYVSGGPRSGMAPRAGPVNGGSPGNADIPVPSDPRDIRLGAGVKVVQPSDAPSRPPCTWPASRRGRRRDSRPASAPPVLRARQPTSRCPRAVMNGSIAVIYGAPRSRASAGQRPPAGTVDRFPSSRSNTRASGGPRLRDAPRPGTRVVGHQGAGIPSRRRRRRSRPGVGGPARSARWVLQLDPLPQACSGQARRRDGRPASAPARPAASQHPRVPVSPSTTVNGAVLRPGLPPLEGSLTAAQWAQPSKLVAREARSGCEMTTSPTAES